MALLLAFASNKNNRLGNAKKKDEPEKIPGNVYRLQKGTLSVTIRTLQWLKRGYRYGSEIKR
jgi:hypothetical protein